MNQFLTRVVNPAAMLRVAITLTALAAAVPANASTFFGGFEDTINGDYDYNDLVFSLSAPSLSLLSTANYYAKPSNLVANGPIGQTGTPFWNNASSDGNTYNVGYCIYGGGNCNGGTALDATAKFLASNNSSNVGSANDVVFSVGSGSVSTTVYLTITAANDFLGWYNTATPGTVNFFSATGNTTGTYNFTPTGNFGLVGRNASSGNSFYSNTSVAQNTTDDVSHFAFFANPVSTPEPGTWALLGSSLLALGFVRRRSLVK